MVRPLPGGHDVGMGFVEGEKGAPVLQHHSALRLQNPGSEGVEEALDPAHRITPLIDCGQVDRVPRIVELVGMTPRFRRIPLPRALGPPLPPR